MVLKAAESFSKLTNTLSSPYHPSLSLFLFGSQEQCRRVVNPVLGTVDFVTAGGTVRSSQIA
jgi:hypothetical protein